METAQCVISGALHLALPNVGHSIFGVVLRVGIHPFQDGNNNNNHHHQ
jgi:hypothetical protein